MKRIIFTWIFLLCFTYEASAISSTEISVLFSGGGCQQSSSFLARASGLDSKHISAYQTLICRLVSSGVWQQLDVFYIFATQNTSTALKNLVSGNFTGIANGGPVFTVDSGYIGIDGSTTVYIDTGYNPVLAGGLFSQNAAHVSLWNNSNRAATGAGSASIGQSDNLGPLVITGIIPKFSDNNLYLRINDASPFTAGVAISDPRGHLVSIRTGSTTQKGYLNSVDQSMPQITSHAPSNGNIYVLAQNVVGTGPANGLANQIMAVSIGGILTAAQVVLFYNALHSYLVTISGIAY